jgi:hypothetical protein
MGRVGRDARQLPEREPQVVNEQWWIFLIILTAIGYFCLGFVWGSHQNIEYFKRGWEAAARSYTGEDLNP